jgi:hypothetical protein
MAVLQDYDNRCFSLVVVFVRRQRAEYFCLVGIRTRAWPPSAGIAR